MSDDEMPVETTAEPSGSVMVHRPFFWGALTIMLIWVAVLFIGVFAEDTAFRYTSAADSVEIPVSLGIAVLAFFATWVVAVVSFRRD